MGAGHVCACPAELFLYCRAHHQCSCIQAVDNAAMLYILLSLRPGRRMKDNCVFEGPACAQHITMGPEKIKRCSVLAICSLIRLARPGSKGGWCSGYDRKHWRSGHAAATCCRFISLILAYLNVSGSSGAEAPAKQGSRLLAGATPWPTSQLQNSRLSR
jgi:hypothetical protein